MSKYQPLADRLARETGREWRASFADVEAALGFPLPKVARASPSWWGNDEGKAHQRAWMAQGWRVEALDRAAETVTFRREGPEPEAAPAAPPAKTPPKGAVAAAVVAGGAVALAAVAAAWRVLRRR